MAKKSRYLYSIVTLTLFFSYKLVGQISKDTTACLIRYTKGNTVSYKIPMTKYCFVEKAGIDSSKGDWHSGWVLSWDVVEKANSNLLFMEMNSTDVEGWFGNDDVSGSVQLVFEIPAFKDSLLLNGLTYKTKGLTVINNYGGIDAKKEYLNGKLKIMKSQSKIYISSSINLITEHPNTKQQVMLSNNSIPILSFAAYQDLEKMVDSIREAQNDLMVNKLAKAIMSRDSIWEIENQRIKDSLKLNPYKGKFRFWISDVDKAGYSRRTYFITGDSLIIKEGPYDFIYLAKNYARDSIYFRKPLTDNEKKSLSKIEKSIELDSLAESYKNFCIIDGLILSFSFESAQFFKDVTVSNYYNETIAFVIGLVNKMVPKKYHLWYDKKILLKQQRHCDK